jgi:alpha-glucosidase
VKPVWLPIVEKSVFRFDESESARKEAAPSISFENAKLREEAIDASSTENDEPQFIPLFESYGANQVVTLKLPTGTSFYGTGEVAGGVERTGKRIYSWNTDAWGYNQNTTSLYQSHPWVFSILPNGQAFGVLADTTMRCEIDLRNEGTIRFVAKASFPVITFGPFSTPEALLTSLGKAIGTIQMPPKWALGYQQCRWSYLTAARVSEVAATFREKNIPCDVVWMDIDYMQGFKCFTFDKDAFPNPKELSDELHSKGFKGIWMLDPGLMVEKGYPAYDSGCEQDVWVQTADGKPYIGECWPGPVHFPDFANKKTRAWWANMVKDFVEVGVDGIWNDMNEPAVFKTVSKTMPETNIHRGDEEFGGKQSHSYYHNVYGMLQARSTYEGMLLADENKRPFVLTRAAFIGAHRYAATWTGDNLANWEHLNMSISMALNLGLSGQSFAGPDIGGFAGDSTPKLFARWMGLGAMLPFARGHSEQGTIDQEPWSFGPEVEDLSRSALERRYRLLPHFYTLFHKAHTTGVPVMTPVFFADPTDSKLRKIDDSFLIGPLLVKTWPTPKKRNANDRVVFPKGIWQRFHFDDDHPELPVLFLKGGAIVPTGPVIQHVGEASPTDTVTLLIALDEAGKASGDLYEDEGDGHGYKNGDYLITHYEAEKVDSHEVVIRIASVQGQRERPKRTLHVRLLIGENVQVEGECIDGDELRIKLPAEDDIKKLVVSKRDDATTNLDRIQSLLDNAFEENHSVMGVGAVQMPEDLENGSVFMTVLPFSGGRISSMIHKASGYEWIEEGTKKGYEEYSGTEYRSSGWNEEYKVVKRERGAGHEIIGLEGDIGGGLILSRELLLPENSQKTVRISSSIVARSVGAGSGGFSRLVCLRIHPMFKLLHAMQTSIRFTAIDGKTHELKPNIDFGETSFRGSDRPNGEWSLLDHQTGLGVTNKFDVNEVAQCQVKWGPGSVTLELWSEERPVSKDTPLSITHEYHLIDDKYHQ